MTRCLIQEARCGSSQLTIDERDNQILGNQVPEEVVAPPPAAEPVAGIVCPNFGSNYTTPVKFCRKCGNKLAE